MNRVAKQAKLLKKTLFIKSNGGHAISHQEKHQLPKNTKRFTAKKRWHSPLPSGCLGTPLPLPQNLYGRAGGGTLTSQPKFLRSIGYQICLAMVLCWRTLRAGSAKKAFLGIFWVIF